MVSEIDDSICPLCQQKNSCSVQAAKASLGCWCMNANVPADLLATLPKSLQGKACICIACIEKYREQQVKKL